MFCVSSSRCLGFRLWSVSVAFPGHTHCFFLYFKLMYEVKLQILVLLLTRIF